MIYYSFERTLCKTAAFRHLTQTQLQLSGENTSITYRTPDWKETISMALHSIRKHCGQSDVRAMNNGVTSEFVQKL